MTSLPLPPIAPPSADEVLIEPRGPRGFGLLAELWRYRDLAWFLALRDVQVRYKQTLMGASWAVVQPVLMMIVFTMVFGRMLGVADEIEAYPVFVYSGLLPWTFFTAAVSGAALSMINNAGMLRKVYFPRLIAPMSALGAPLLDLLLALGVLVLLMIGYQMVPTAKVLLLPVLVLSVMVTAAGVGITLAALTIRYRDIKHVVPFLMQVWLFITPVIYPLDITNNWRIVVDLNPVAGTIEAFRAVVLDQPIPWAKWGISVGLSLVILAGGSWLFSRTERLFADLA